jgi:hypothetical protein
MFQYVFLPLHQHIDQGFGATGDAFKRAADRLSEPQEIAGVIHGHLPVNFLYRHSIELFLKSMIIVLHRTLVLPFGDHPADGDPYVLDKGNWKKIHQVHSIRTLFEHFRFVVTNHQDRLAQIAKTRWADIPAELPAWIDLIDSADGSSTYFRYPTRDAVAESNKSSWRQVDLSLVSSHPEPEESPKMMVLGVNNQQEVLSAYLFDDEPLAELSKALRDASELLSGAHAGIRVELAGGR